MTSFRQPSDQLVPVFLLKYSLGRHQTLTTEPDEFIGHYRCKHSPGFPVAEIGDLVIGEIGSQHVAN